MWKIFLITCVYSLDVKYKGASDELAPIQNGELSKWWEYDHNGGQPCHPAPTKLTNQDSDTFVIITGEGERFIEGSVTRPGHELSPTHEINHVDVDTTEFTVTYNCADDAAWSRVHLHLTFITPENSNLKYAISYIKICDSEKISRFDWGSLSLMIIAVCIVFLASQQTNKLEVLQDEEHNELQPIHAVLFVICGSISLATIFFLIYYANIALSVLISISASTAITLLLGEILGMLPFLQPTVNIPRVGEVGYNYIVSFCCAVTIVATYLATKYWILNNFIGIFMVFMFIKALRLSSLKVAVLLLGLAFFYDIFWVFLSSYFFGQNVMVTVATGLDLPMKLECPHIGGNHPIENSCSMIGLGDLVLPGIVIAFAYRVDMMLTRSKYYLATVIAYIVALCACEAVLVLTLSAQPALLYISPCVLGAFCIMACRRSEFKELWSGNVEDLNKEEEYSALELHNSS